MATLVESWDVDFIATVGDNNYHEGEASTIDQNVGQYFQAYIHPYQGSYGSGASENRFFPALGNHDWRTDQAQSYFDYFTLPGNERYYDLEWGPVHLFIVDSDPNEPDGRTPDSVQARSHFSSASLESKCWLRVLGSMVMLNARRLLAKGRETTGR